MGERATSLPVLNPPTPPESDAPPVIEISGLSFSYDGSPILSDVDLTIRRGELMCIVGPNGGGKTTLLKLILGLLEPSRGIVRVFGERPHNARRRIGYVPQNVHLDLQFPINVMDVVLLGRLGRHTFGPYRADDLSAAADALRTVGLFDRRRAHLGELSGGQRQRVLIARALAGGPELLLLDEPTANLDPRVENEFYELLNELNRRLTIVAVSHDLRFVSQYVRKVVCVSRSVRIHYTSEVADNTLRDVYGAPVRVIQHQHRTGE